MTFRGLGLILYRKETTRNPTQPFMSPQTPHCVVRRGCVSTSQPFLFGGGGPDIRATTALPPFHYWKNDPILIPSSVSPKNVSAVLKGVKTAIIGLIRLGICTLAYIA